MSAHQVPLRVLMLGVVDSRHVEHLAIAVSRLGHDVHVVGEATGDRPMSDLAADGIALTVLTPRPSRIPGVKAIRRTLAIRRVIASWKPDVVHAHYVWYYGLFALLAGARPLVVSAWGSDVLRASRKADLLNRVVVRRAAFMLGDSLTLIDRVRKLGASDNRSAVVNWGVDLDRFFPATNDRADVRRRLRLPDGPLVLAPRELDPIYNPRVILAAFEQVLRVVPNAQLVFKHQGFARPDLGPMAAPDRVTFVGDVPYEQLPDFYRAADVCVSIPSSDSSPRSVWEAMAAGCACVLSDLPWVTEEIEPGRHAVVTPIAPADVADALIRVLTEPDLATSLQREGRELAVRERSQKVEMGKLVEIYQRVLEGSRSLDTLPIR